MEIQHIKSAVFSLVICSLFSCTVNDRNDDMSSNSETLSDHSEAVNTPAIVDSIGKTKPTIYNSPDTMAAPGMAPGTVKPDPSKKGMKGKVSLNDPGTKGTANATPDNSGTYVSPEILPSFPGGYKGMQKFFDDNLQYPEDASNEGVEGVVNVSFIVDENGKLSNPKVDGTNPGYGLDKEAIRVINKMPSWNPGKLKGKNVKTRFSLPVRFVLGN